jgi:toxin ParE1/3/4
MLKITLNSKADSDFENIFEYYDAISNKVADNFIDDIEACFRFLTENPLAGRQIEDSEIREWVLQNWPYVIPYKTSDNEIIILRIYHISRNPNAKF